MNKINESLVEFHFGLLDEDQRLLVEREMLTDPEVLLDYLDLKRKIEGQIPVPQKPSPFLWQRLSHLSKKKKTWYWTFAVGAAAATLACLYLFSQPKGEIVPFAMDKSILFDSGAEHSFASDVL